MDNPTGVPSEPLPQSEQVGTHSPVPPKQNKLKKIFASIAANDFIQAAFVLLILIFVAEAGYYIGWHGGYNKGYNSGYTAGSNTNYCGGQGLCNGVDKPVIYLYPTKTEPVSVRVTYPAGFSYTDPTYNPGSGWQVLASPNGQLTNIRDGEHYPYLVWEGNPAPLKFNMTRGFVVPGYQTASFLHKELPIIGLSPGETNSFIAYWQPRMNNNAYNLIHFAGSEYTDYAKLTVSPQPNSELRVFMAFQPLTQPVPVTPQSFSGFERKGFTVVEWGGTDLER